MTAKPCVLCDTDGGELIWRGDRLRAIRRIFILN